MSWICNIFLELGIFPSPTLVHGDNQGSIFIGSNPVQEICMKHIDIKYHYVHECIAEKKINMFFVPSEENTADLFTKNLGHLKFEKFRAHLEIKFLP